MKAAARPTPPLSSSTHSNIAARKGCDGGRGGIPGPWGRAVGWFLGCRAGTRPIPPEGPGGRCGGTPHTLGDKAGFLGGEGSGTGFYGDDGGGGGRRGPTHPHPGGGPPPLSSYRALLGPVEPWSRGDVEEAPDDVPLPVGGALAAGARLVEVRAWGRGAWRGGGGVGMTGIRPMGSRFGVKVKAKVPRGQTQGRSHKEGAP